jgi:TPR repeat protein
MDMGRTKSALAGLVVLLAAGSGNAQSLQAGLDAVRRANWPAALAELVPLAEAGDPDALYALGTIYANGDGVTPDPAKADALLGRAALAGHRLARAHLDFLRGTEGWRVQLATVPTPDSAQREFKRLARQYGGLLAGTDLLAPPFTMPDGAQVVRVQAGPLSEARARDICARLRDLNAGCRVIRPEG